MSLRYRTFLHASHDRLQYRRRRLQFESLESRSLLATDTTSDPDSTLADLISVVGAGSEIVVANSTTTLPANPVVTAATNPTAPVAATATASSDPAPIAVEPSDPTDSS